MKIKVVYDFGNYTPKKKTKKNCPVHLHLITLNTKCHKTSTFLILPKKKRVVLLDSYLIFLITTGTAEQKQKYKNKKNNLNHAKLETNEKPTPTMPCLQNFTFHHNSVTMQWKCMDRHRYVWMHSRTNSWWKHTQGAICCRDTEWLSKAAMAQDTYLSTHTVYQYKIHFFHFFFWGGGLATLENGYRKTSFSWDFAVVLNRAKRLKNCWMSTQLADTRHRQTLTNWPSAIS